MKYVATLNGKRYEIEIERVDGYKPLDRGAAAVASAPIIAAAPAPAPAAPAPAPAAAGGQSVDAPMPGKILGVKASAGQAVKKGQVVLILEAMKMENEIVAPQNGTIATINVNTGDSVEPGATLATMN